MIQDLISLVEKVKEKITDETDMLWTCYETPAELRAELEANINALKNEKTNCLESLNMHFLPTATFQEHSLMNGWADEYIKLAKKFDKFYAAIKK